MQGIAPDLRAELWPLLLGVFQRDSSQRERSAELERLRRWGGWQAGKQGTTGSLGQALGCWECGTCPGNDETNNPAPTRLPAQAHSPPAPTPFPATRLYVKLVLVCRELDAQLQALRNSTINNGVGGGGSAGSAAANGSEAGSALELGGAESAALSVRSEAGSSAAGAAAPLPLPGNLAAFAEAHRIVVMDAVRTDLRRSSAEAQPGGPIGGPAAATSTQPALTVLPVAVGDGLPELMLVSPPDPPPPAASSEAELAAAAADPAAAAAPGRHLPRWCSALAHDTLWGAAHLDDPTRAQMLRLINLLSAYAVHDPETGYCQGM